MSLPQFEWNPYTPAYASVGAVAYDIQANDPQKLSMLGIAAPNEGRPCRWIQIATAGTITVTRPDGASVVLKGIAGQTFNVQAIAITASTVGAVTDISVYW